ncbi:MAG: phytanoyl-CoA dioxygenase family protein, partial [Pseudomonadota bacterium]
SDCNIKIPGVLSPTAVMKLSREIVSTLEHLFDASLDGGFPTGDGATPAAGRRFYSADMIWLDNDIIRQFVLSPRIAKICADLLGVDKIRLYHDNLLSKEPGCGRTPWHYDDHHFPLASNDVVTAWIAAQAIPKRMGPLAFARGMSTWELVRDIEFNKRDTSYDREVAAAFDRADIEVDDSAFAIGDVSFHHNLSFHTAGPNLTGTSRCVLANTFYADGVRVVDAPTLVSGDWQKFLPGIGPGDIAASPLNPICWPASDDWNRGPTFPTTSRIADDN